MPKHVFSRQQYLDILNDSLSRHPGWCSGMAFVFLPPGATAAEATGVGGVGPDEWLPVYAEIERVASELIEVRDHETAAATGYAAPSPSTPTR